MGLTMGYLGRILALSKVCMMHKDPGKGKAAFLAG